MKCTFQTTLSVGMILACEIFPASRRGTAGILSETFYAVGIMVLALLGYLIRHWRHLVLVTAAPVVLVIPLFW